MPDSTTPTDDGDSTENGSRTSPTPQTELSPTAGARRSHRRAGAPAGAPAATQAAGTEQSSAAPDAPRTSVPQQTVVPAQGATTAESAPARKQRRRAGAPAGAPVFVAPTAARTVAPSTPEQPAEELDGPEDRNALDEDEPTGAEQTSGRPSPEAPSATSVAEDLRALAITRGESAGTEEGGDSERARREKAQLDFASLLFQAPAPAQRRTTVGSATSAADGGGDDAAEAEAEAGTQDEDTRVEAQTPEDEQEAREGSRRRSRSGRGRSRGGDGEGAERPGRDSSRDDVAGDDQASAEAETSEDEQDGEDDQAVGGSSRRRRRRGGRGRRGRGRGEDERDEQDERSEEDAPGDDSRGGTAGADGDPSGRSGAGGGSERGEDGEDEGSGSPEDDGGDEGEGSSGSRRRRRRRRRSGSSETDASPDDPPNTVVKVREARDEVKAVKGSTRLEAKKQRRREGRDHGRKRAVITEAEFLARRESVKRSMIVRERAGRTQIAVLEDDVLVEHYVAQKSHTSMVGNVYLGKVQNVLPSMEAAFVDIGKGRNAVLYAGEVNWDAVGLEGQPRRIELALKSGDPVLVQVTKDPIGHKGARLTSQISLPGRYVVFVPGGSMTGISRKLPDTERVRLKKIMRQLIPEDAGVIVRTAAEGASEEELTHDVERLRSQWETIQKAQKSKSAPVALSQEPDLAIKVVRDVFNEDFTSLVVQGSGAYEAVHAYVSDVAPDLLERVTAHVGEKDVFAKYRIDEQLLKAMDRKVYLPSGGSLVIDRTEAMTVVDVNTGKFTGSGGTLEETVTKNNLESAEEIVRQLRLRDIGGIIVIDFIDMVLESNRDLVLRRLVECLGRDRTKHQVAEVTSLGLVQMTRKRVGQGLVETFSTSCEHCSGRGIVVDLDGEPHQHVEAGESIGSSPRSGKRRRGKGRGGRDAEESGGETGGSKGGGTHGQSGNGHGANGSAGDPSDVHRLQDDDSRALAKATIASIAAASTGQQHQPEIVVDGQVVMPAEGAAAAKSDVSAAEDAPEQGTRQDAAAQEAQETAGAPDTPPEQGTGAPAEQA